VVVAVEEQVNAHGVERILAVVDVIVAYIQRIMVSGIGARDKAIVRRVMRGGIQDAIHAQKARFLIHFILYLAGLGDFNHRCKAFRTDTFH